MVASKMVEISIKKRALITLLLDMRSMNRTLWDSVDSEILKILYEYGWKEQLFTIPQQ